MTRDSKRTFLFAISILIVVAICFYGWKLHEAYQSKVEWSILQAAEINNRQNGASANVLLLSDSGYHLAGIINQGKPQATAPAPLVDRIWILLDPKFRPHIKILNGQQPNFVISRDEFQKITAYTKVDTQVATELSTHIR